ncbi:MAG: transposase [Butyribacter sp.]|uniref:transposase n=1 Tax=Butyribacter sp. TaxID=2822465 RepID=UPI00383F0273|nr:transposase [Clostridium sp.]MCQ5167587.1 transposase [Roseburia hominis]
MNNNNSLSHTTWNCKYHIVFAPKYRRKVAYGKLREDIRNQLQEDLEYDQMTIKEYVDPFTGEPVKKNN